MNHAWYFYFYAFGNNKTIRIPTRNRSPLPPGDHTEGPRIGLSRCPGFASRVYTCRVSKISICTDPGSGENTDTSAAAACPCGLANAA